jgi:hypothetical protein
LIYFSPRPIFISCIKTKAGTFTNRLPQARWFPGNGDVADKSANVADSASPSFEEGDMARRDFPLNIDRRRLLATGAAVATAAIALRADRVDAALANAAQPALPPAETPAIKVFAASARRLREIAGRNEIRRQAGLPLLSIRKELRRMKEHEDGELRRIEFESFRHTSRPQQSGAFERISTSSLQNKFMMGWTPRRRHRCARVEC